MFLLVPISVSLLKIVVQCTCTCTCIYIYMTCACILLNMHSVQHMGRILVSICTCTCPSWWWCIALPLFDASQLYKHVYLLPLTHTAYHFFISLLLLSLLPYRECTLYVKYQTHCYNLRATPLKIHCSWHNRAVSLLLLLFLPPLCV